MPKHLAVCINTEQGRVPYVVSASTWEECVKVAERMDHRVGYFGCDSFLKAVDYASAMARGEYKKPNLSQYRRVR